MVYSKKLQLIVYLPLYFCHPENKLPNKIAKLNLSLQDGNTRGKFIVYNVTVKITAMNLWFSMSKFIL